MKKISVLLLGSILFLLCGCYEVNEDIVINADGSGTYNSKMDMGQLLEMIQMFGAGDSLMQEGLDKKIDTVINMGSLSDSMENLAGPRQELMKNGSMHMQMDMNEKLFKVDMHFSYRNMIQLQDLMSGMGGGNTNGMSQAFKSLFGANAPDSSTPDVARDPELDQLKDVYVVKVKNGLISKYIDSAKMKSLMARPEMQQLQSMTGAGIEIKYNSTIHLPRPAIKVESPVATVSDDKKTITFSYNLLDMFEHPEKFSYKIEY
ncbi:MAG TPA: hypothetical protein VFS31_14660 [Chitinophagaceae bacterium]|nr:hypothetical protein [Chitinophagaceae bacterium]